MNGSVSQSRLIWLGLVRQHAWKEDRIEWAEMPGVRTLQPFFAFPKCVQVATDGLRAVSVSQDAPVPFSKTRPLIVPQEASDKHSWGLSTCITSRLGFQCCRYGILSLHLHTRGVISLAIIGLKGCAGI